MNEFQMRTVKGPERCEICHMSDSFDPITNSCARCDSVEAWPVKMEFERPENRYLTPRRPATHDGIDLSTVIYFLLGFWALFGVGALLLFIIHPDSSQTLEFLVFAVFVMVIASLAAFCIFILYGRLKDLLAPLSEDATRLRYQLWKANREKKTTETQSNNK